jgi:hypothetical protein
MTNNAPRRRGRPRGSVNAPQDIGSGVWVAVLLTRIAIRRRTGKTPSVRAACHELAVNGGVISAIDGNRAALTLASAQLKKKL